MQVNLDGYALPIKKLKGTEPVESLDLSQKGAAIGVASAIVIASLIRDNASLTRIDVRINNIAGDVVAASALIDGERVIDCNRIGCGRGCLVGMGWWLDLPFGCQVSVNHVHIGHYFGG